MEQDTEGKIAREEYRRVQEVELNLPVPEDGSHKNMSMHGAEAAQKPEASDADAVIL